MNLFFSTEPAPCPYLAERLERRLVTAIAGAAPEQLHDRLLRAGFRRSQGYAYRPACTGCQACVAACAAVLNVSCGRAPLFVRFLWGTLNQPETRPPRHRVVEPRVEGARLVAT